MSDLLEFIGRQPRDTRRVCQQLLEVGDLGSELSCLGFEFDEAEPGEPAQPELENVFGLDQAQVEDIDQPGASLFAVVALPDDLDHFVDIDDRNQEAFDEVQSLLAAREPEETAPTNDAEPVVEVDLQQFFEAERAGAAVDERDIVDAEAVFERGQPVELLEHGIRAESRLDADNQSHAVFAIGKVCDIRDATDFFGGHSIFDLLDHTLSTDEKRKLGDDEPHLAGGDRLH